MQLFVEISIFVLKSQICFIRSIILWSHSSCFFALYQPHSFLQRQMFSFHNLCTHTLEHLVWSASAICLISDLEVGLQLRVSNYICHSFWYHSIQLQYQKYPLFWMHCPISLTPVAEVEYTLCFRSSTQHTVYVLRNLCRWYWVAETDLLTQKGIMCKNII